MDHWGRKPIFVSSLLLTGIAAIPAGFMDDGAAKTILALLGNCFFGRKISHFLTARKNSVLSGKFGAAGSFSIVYLYTAELYPTVVRSTAIGMCSMMARIGGIAAPQVIYIFFRFRGFLFVKKSINGNPWLIGYGMRNSGTYFFLQQIDLLKSN